MNHKATTSVYRSTRFLILMFAGLILINSASLAASKKRPNLSAADADIGELPKPQILDADTNPTLRYPAASFSGWSVFSTSYGWFDINKDGIRYTPVEPKKKQNEGFERTFQDGVMLVAVRSSPRYGPHMREPLL